MRSLRPPIRTVTLSPGRTPIALAAGSVSSRRPRREPSAARWNCEESLPLRGTICSVAPSSVSSRRPAGPAATICWVRTGAAAFTPAMRPTSSATR
jgi:hypothetical protein